MNRVFTLYPAVLARLEADLFTAVESLDFRIEELEEALDAEREDERAIVAQVKQNSRDIAHMRARSRPAA